MLLLSPGNVNDIATAATLIAAAGPITGLIADKAYDANNLCQLLALRTPHQRQNRFVSEGAE